MQVFGKKAKLHVNALMSGSLWGQFGITVEPFCDFVSLGGYFGITLGSSVLASENDSGSHWGRFEVTLNELLTYEDNLG